MAFEWILLKLGFVYEWGFLRYFNLVGLLDHNIDLFFFLTWLNLSMMQSSLQHLYLLSQEDFPQT